MSTSTPIATAQALGLTSSLFLSGIYFGSSQLTLPLLYDQPPAVSTPIFASFYHRGAATVGPLIVFSSLLSTYLAYVVPEQRVEYIVAGLATFWNLPWTMLVMIGGIHRLLELSESEVEREKAGQEEVVQLLRTWRWQNFARSAMAMVGGAIGIWVLFK